MDDMVLNGLSDGIVVINSEQRILRTNTAFDRLFGYAPEELLDRDIGILTEPDDYIQLRTAIQSAWWTRKPQKLQTVLVGIGGREIDSDISISHIVHESACFALSIRDISHLKIQEEKKDLFIAMASHEMRSLVSGVMLTIEMLLTYYDRITDDKRLQKLQHIRQQTLSMAEMVNTVLDVTQFDGRTRTQDNQISVIKSLEEVISELQPAAEARGQKVIPLIGEVNLTIRGDGSDIKRIWRNLIGNALKYSGEGQSIEVSLYRSSPSSQDQWRIANIPLDISCFALPDVFTRKDCIIGIVKDYGHGIPSEDVPRLFNRFYRGWAADSGIPGTGLGLSLVHDILHAYGGDIMVISNEGEGSTFCFWMPVDASKTPENGAVTAVSPASV